MANLLGQNIGTNYKGILNLNTLNGNLSGTLQAVTDGDGNASPLTLSTGEIGISRTIALSAGSSNVRLINETYTINNSGAQTGTATGIFLNATETALNGMGHNLLDLQRDGVSQFRVSRIGDTTSNGTFTSLNSYTNFIGNRFQISTGAVANRTLLVAVGEGIMRISDSTEANFNRLQLGGTTNAFPAIKRNGAAIDFRLADDSGFCDINAKFIYADSNLQTAGYLRFGNTGMWLRQLDSTNMGLQRDNQGPPASVRFGGLTDVGILIGTGSPEAARTAPVGSIFLRTDGGSGTSFYVKESGTGNTGWVAK
jgi:hypothetical protein